MIVKPRACVIILNSSKEILLIKRQKVGETYWVFPGGSIESGETAEQAAIREAYEELSLIVTLKSVLFSQTNEGRDETYFLVDSYSGDIKLGSGPELHRQNHHNTYEPVWVLLKEIVYLNLVPLSAKEKITHFFKSDNLE